MIQRNTKKTTEEFIKEAINIHGYKFNYSKLNYMGAHNKIIIICPIHGEFSQRASYHLNTYGCPKCGRVTSGNQHGNMKEFLEKAKLKHCNKFDYSIVNYKRSNIKVKIICPIHGIFEQRPATHLISNDCPEYSREIRDMNRTMSIKSFKDKAIKIHQNKYDYSLIKYIKSKQKIKIICYIHGTFIHGTFIQGYKSHLSGSGCPKCNSSKGEVKIINFLDKNNIHYHHEHKFNDCLSPLNNHLVFDFFLPSHNLCIEYDGKHGLKQIKLHDKIKNEYCKINNINILRISYTKFENINFLINQQLNWNENIIDELFC